MFWKNRRYVDKDIGELSYISGMWHGESSVPAGSVLIDIEGEKDGPNVHALTQAKSILAELDRIKIEATAYIESEDIDDFMRGNGSLVFDGFTSYIKDSRFDLGFGLSGWDDAIIVVQFQEGRPCGLQLCD
ncbi:hypothetical protein [Shewanella algae]|uniref:hypothetical protein n=1 Tax=Shewanella algae TaxID=38313 RepID=UPI001AACA82D|nr:hypothetical protein [Shewanella algae]MBO2587850.1 hypothetical protein [Shewanella algae]QTE83274.1 hypothetical protein JKK46_05050 [Shewanella algae]